jgi:hypothetical protein
MEPNPWLTNHNSCTYGDGIPSPPEDPSTHYASLLHSRLQCLQSPHRQEAVSMPCSQSSWRQTSGELQQTRRTSDSSRASASSRSASRLSCLLFSRTRSLPIRLLSRPPALLTRPLLSIRRPSPLLIHALAPPLPFHSRFRCSMDELPLWAVGLILIIVRRIP